MVRKAAGPPVVPIFISDLPRVDEEALATFVRLTDGNTYQNSTIGKSKAQDEGTACDCAYEHGKDQLWEACGEGSNCINRLTLVECMDGDCPSRGYCLNQRFQRKQYADISVVKTEKKGFGLRAETDMPADTFIYEYIGEVVKEPEFMRRMHRYAEEGIRHFYFMMLQKEEFIDATKKGDIGRFANHSCNPNCYVSKWFVGKRVRMGIFSKRAIFKGEELVFNYNVDRYGHDAQECYCGEPNCVGFIGGKTQTDIGGMDDLYIDALGIADDVEAQGLKGSRKKKGRKLGDDFVPILRPVTEDEVPNVMNAISRASTSNKKMLPHLLARLKMTDSIQAQRSAMRLRGFSLMKSLLLDYAEDLALVKLILETLQTWRISIRNKIEDSQIEETIREFYKTGDDDIKRLGDELIATWSILPLTYRIPRRARQDDEIPTVPTAQQKRRKLDPSPYDQQPSFSFDIPPAIHPDPIRPYVVPSYMPSMSSYLPSMSPDVPAGLKRMLGDLPGATVPYAEPTRNQPTKDELTAIIERAKIAAQTAAAEAEAKAEAERTEAEVQAAKDAKARAASAKRKEKSKNGNSKSKSKDKGKAKEKEKLGPTKEKQLLKMVGDVVVSSMSKYREDIDRGRFKYHARKLSHKLTEKEKRGRTFYKAETYGPYPIFPKEKKIKIKEYVHLYMQKLMKKIKEKSQVKSSDPRKKPPAESSKASVQHEEPDDIVADMMAETDEDGNGSYSDQSYDSDDEQIPAPRYSPIAQPEALPDTIMTDA